MNTFSKTISHLPLIILIAFSIFSKANATLAHNTRNDYQVTRISGGSMLPILQSGETAVVYKAYPFKKIRIGDIVIIECSRGFSVIHRVVRRSRGGNWITQGDNNRHEDTEILSSRNFGGLALVDESVTRFQKYIAKTTPTSHKSHDFARFMSRLTAPKKGTTEQLNRSLAMALSNIL